MKEKTTEAIEALLNAMNEEVPLDDEMRCTCIDTLKEFCECLMDAGRIANAMEE